MIARNPSMPMKSTHRPSLLMALCAIFLTAGSGGCSFLFVDGPPEKHRQLPYFTCSTSKAWPVVDTIFAAAYAIETAAVLGTGTGSGSSGSATVALVPAAAAALMTASAVYGYGKTSSCREATDELQLRLIRMQPTPGANPWQQGPNPYQPPSPYQPVPYQPPPPVDPWLVPPTQSFGAPAPAQPPQPASNLKKATQASPATPGNPPTPTPNLPEEKR
jgi:hypothetical protein